MLTKISSRVVRGLPEWIRISPIDTMIAFMGVLSSATNLIGMGSSRTLSVMPVWGRVLWGVAFLVGCACWLVGLTSLKKSNGHYVFSRIPAMILGLYLVSLTAFAYGVGIVFLAGWAGVLPATSMWAVALGTWLRRVDVSDRFRGD